MNVVERAKSIILKPADSWIAIEQETTDLQKLYVPYLVVLAIIPAVAGFIGMSIFGVTGFGFSMRIPVITGLGLMLSQYVMTLVMIFVWGWLISMLAGTFGGQPNLMNAVKLTVYASTPAMVAGLFQAIPGLSILAVLGGLYSLYLVYLGLPVLMKNPREKSLPYMAVAAIVGIVCSVLISLASTIFMPSPSSRMQGMTGDASMTIKTADGEVKIDVKSMEEMAKRLEAMASEKEKENKK